MLKPILRPFVRFARRMPVLGGLPGLRPPVFPRPSPPPKPAEISPAAKKRKLDRIRPLLRDDLEIIETPGHINALTPLLRKRFNIVATDAVSAHNYDPIARGIIDKCKGGLVLDCGCGLRQVYYEDVVNFEIVPYSTTDVLGVGECLPFKDNSFDAVFSLNVLEHVRDPFECAKEIARVLKPGGELYCVVPFLQPLHGYPHHYYNMTHQGLRNLFDSHLEVVDQTVTGSGLPVFTLTWFLRHWAMGLPPRARKQFLRAKVRDLIGCTDDYLQRPWVAGLSKDVNLELASATTLFARKAA